MKTDIDRKARGWKEMELFEERRCQGGSAASGARPHHWETELTGDLGRGLAFN